MTQWRIRSVMAIVALAGIGLAWPVSGQTPPAANPILVLDTAKGVIEIELLRGDAPKSVDYIVALVRKNFYRGLRFHRVERMLVQVGDPTSRDVSKKAWWGRTGTTPTVGIAEISRRLTHVRGTVGLAHVGDPKYASSQFYIMKDASTSLNGKYAIIGRVRAGMPVVDQIQAADVLKQATIKGAAPK